MFKSLVVLSLLAAVGCGPKQPRPAVQKAAEYLWSRQESDGGWHSHTYGLLRSGQALTPFVLDALLQLPDPQPPDKVDRALAFVRERTQPNGALGMSDRDIPDYPNYATALAVSAIVRAKRDGWQKQVQPMVTYLRSQQFTEQNGWQPKDPAYGAWGMGGERRTPPGTGHVDLSMTRYVLEALRAAGAVDSDPAFTAARVLLERCQNPDGGLFFSTTEADTNKAGQDGERYRSYGSTTADGVLALLAIGIPPTDSRIVSARAWLTGHHHGMDVPGFVGPAYQRWPRGLAFYYSAASTRAVRDRDVTQELHSTQRADGSWANPENLVKEDDPLIATPFALVALLNAAAH